MFGIKNIHSEHKPDFLLIVFIFIIIAFGLVMLASASSDLAKMEFGNSYFYLNHQLLYGLLPGLIGFFIASNIYYQNYKKLIIPLFILNIILLVLVFSPLGVTSGGASRWLNIGLIFQPSEFLKIFFIIYIAAWLSGGEKRKNSFWGGFVPFLAICGLISFLLLIQPSTSIVAILMLTALLIYFVSGAKISYILITIALAATVFFGFLYLAPDSYRTQRIMSFMDPNQNVLSANYQINQSLIAIGSGNIFGVGYGESTTKIRYLPEPIGDSIFAVIAEELGFVGGIALILCFLILITRIFILAKRSRDHFAQLLLVGFGSLIGIQVFVNMGSISGLIPLTGVPLPFISYGGTALAVFMTISGIIVNITKHEKN
ncbi:MAG: putative peptidoglycan glycosyltransferase FtsW [Patescibacteria group bacterium]